MSSFESYSHKSEKDYNPSQSPEGMSLEQLKTYSTAEELLSGIDSLENFKLLKDHGSLLSALPNQELVVRREDPDRIEALVRDGEPVPLSFVGGSPYANSVEWNPKVDGARGLDNAFLEGYSHKNNVVTVYGFEKPADFFFEKLDDSQRVFAGVDRSRVRAAAGFVQLENVRFISVRIPLTALPEEELTEAEKDALYDYEESKSKNREPVFAYRSYVRSDDRVIN